MGAEANTIEGLEARGQSSASGSAASPSQPSQPAMSPGFSSGAVASSSSSDSKGFSLTVRTKKRDYRFKISSSSVGGGHVLALGAAGD